MYYKEDKKNIMHLLYHHSELAPDILKMEFWTHMGRTANIIIKDIIHIFASMCKNMHILVMGGRYRERWSFLNAETKKVVEILPCGRPGPVYAV